MKVLSYITGVVTICCGSFASVYAQDSTLNEDAEIYYLEPSVDVPIIAVAGGWSYYALSKIYKKDSTSAEDILALKRDDINGLDRWASYVYYPDAERASDKIFYGAMPFPLLLLIDKEIRKDALKIAVLYTEALSITGALYTSATYFNRYRPSTFSDKLSLEQKRSGNQRNSFFAGHVALVATSTFFTAKVFSDYHPGSNLKWVFYGAAVAATGGTAYLRHRAGKHFPTDIALGIAVGTLSGILVPQTHKRKKLLEKKVHIYPFTGESTGVALVYKIK
ncbi:MAG: phosphatase PAP2 family protein [Chitinophagaceae bacterium]|nr:phosphatase PAP2 family protein [Chitinophagaceae bacterium]